LKPGVDDFSACRLSVKGYVEELQKLLNAFSDGLRSKPKS
jgi:hypothetical protein